MASDDLGKYLEDLGISLEDEPQAELEIQAELLDPEELAPPPPQLIPLDAGVADRAESFLVTLLLSFDPAYSVTVEKRSEGQELQIDVHGGDPGKIIGRGGRTLSALEYVTNAVVNRDEEYATRVVIDVGGYKRRRDERLQQNAQKLADRARKAGEPQEFEPMTAAERRIVHMALADIPGVYSESSGEGRDRRVVVFPEE